MRILKIGISVVCACCVAVPAFAADKPAVKKSVVVNSSAKPSEKPSSDTQIGDGVTFDTKNPSDPSKIKLDRKAYIKQIEDAFDKMDANGDGQVDGNEMSGGNPWGPRDGYGEELPVAAQPAGQSYPSQAAPTPAVVAPVGGVPPVNEKELIKK